MYITTSKNSGCELTKSADHAFCICVIMSSTDCQINANNNNNNNNNIKIKQVPNHKLHPHTLEVGVKLDVFKHKTRPD
jgi:hypothetical protein